jgi:hypothetical protein
MVPIQHIKFSDSGKADIPGVADIYLYEWLRAIYHQTHKFTLKPFNGIKLIEDYLFTTESCISEEDFAVAAIILS